MASASPAVAPHPWAWLSDGFRKAHGHDKPDGDDRSGTDRVEFLRVGRVELTPPHELQDFHEHRMNIYAHIADAFTTLEILASSEEVLSMQEISEITGRLAAEQEQLKDEEPWIMRALGPEFRLAVEPCS